MKSYIPTAEKIFVLIVFYLDFCAFYFFLREKTSRTITWQYDRAKGYFTNQPPENFAPDAVAVILVREDCYIEIFKRCNAYIYGITELYFDDDFGLYYWAPAANIIRSGFYDTKEKAILSAKDALNGRM